MEAWMGELGVAMKLREIGVTEEMVDGIAEAVTIAGNGYKKLTREEILNILKASL